MSSYTSETLQEALKNQIRRLNNKIERLEKLSGQISNIRFIAFIAGLVAIYLAAQSGSTLIFALTVVAFIIAFGILVRRHRNIDEASEKLAGWKHIRQEHVARMNLQWDELPDWQQSKTYESHPFARDFNIVGQHSLLHLIDTTTYPGSRAKLESWLLQRHPDVKALKKRHKLVKELRSKAHFRDRLQLYSKLARKQSSENSWDMSTLLQWLQSSPKKGFGVPLAVLATLSALNIILLALFLTGVLAPYVIISFVIYLVAYNFYSGKVSGLFEEATQLYRLLSRFSHVLQYLESYPYKKQSELNKFCAPFHDGKHQPSRYLKQIIRIASAASSQGSELTWLILNGLVPWDMYFARRLQKFKTDLEPKLNEWVHRFYELEALNAMANFGWLNPEYSFALPAPQTEPPVIDARDLGHPLIPKNQKVTNNVRIERVGDIQLITGSNMAGKSTYLRTVGINLALCFAGAPVNASSLETIPFRLFSSINVTDSLDEGLSHFYAEVKHLRSLLNELQKPHDYPLFFMVDEIYRGTNNRERLTGSEAFLKHVAGKDGIGLVTTHDLQLARLEDEIPTLSNWHFEETIEDGKMRFEYKLKSGPCPSTNALKIMQMEGLPVE